MAESAIRRGTCIFTLGHSSRSEEEFFSLLKERGIQHVVDVRRFPGSRRHPQFSRESLERTLPEASMVYHTLGRELGGFRKEGYENYMASAEYAEGIGRLVSIAQKAPTAVLCAEALYFRCHRRFIAETLLSQGHEVVHILGEGRDMQHQSIPEQSALPL